MTRSLFILCTALILSSCLNTQDGKSCAEVGSEINCSEVSEFSILMKDTFTRTNVVPEILEDVIGWRKIIDDRGRIVADQAGNNVNAEITDEQDLGPAAQGTKYLTLYGRAGGSVHNIYLVTETLNLSQVFAAANVMTVKFKYLPINLEQNEYLKLEICNSTAEECGVGENITTDGLNSDSWKTIFEIGSEDLETSFNGRNHAVSDYRVEHVPIYLESLQKQEFVIRFNARMDEGFIGNNQDNDMEDGVLLDEVQVTAMNAPKVDDKDDEDIELIIDRDKLIIVDDETGPGSN